MSDPKTYKVLGVAEYEAHWIQRSYMVKLEARGLLPCSNFEAQLEKRPERVSPPMWDMVFFVEDRCEKRVRPFLVNAIIYNAVGANTISVRDALGEHEIPIEHQLSTEKSEPLLTSTSDLDLYMVYAKLPKIDDAHHGCIVVPADSIVTAIHYRIFGPAPKSECDRFSLENCIESPSDSSGLKLLGGEIPWPLISEK